jgi:hypothetical protein
VLFERENFPFHWIWVLIRRYVNKSHRPVTLSFLFSIVLHYNLVYPFDESSIQAVYLVVCVTRSLKQSWLAKLPSRQLLISTYTDPIDTFVYQIWLGSPVRSMLIPNMTVWCWIN